MSEWSGPSGAAQPLRTVAELSLVAALAGACGGRLLPDGAESTLDAGATLTDAAFADIDAAVWRADGGGLPNDAGGSNGTVVVTVELDGPGTIVSVGLVSASCAPPPGASYPATCTLAVPRGASVSLRAAPGTGYRFDRWTKCPNVSGDLCRLTPTASTRVSASLAPCASRGPSADPVYVDGTLGIDDPSTGAGVGTCAVKTITYALAHAVGGISIAPGSYPSLSEPTPLTLTGTQSFSCAAGTTFVNQDPTPGVGVVAIGGTSNVVSGCTFDDAVLQGTGIHVVTSGLAGAPHRIERARFTHAFSQGVLIDPGVAHVAIATARFERAYAGIEVGAGGLDITVADLSFDLMNLGVWCHGTKVDVPVLFAKCVGCLVPTCP